MRKKTLKRTEGVYCSKTLEPGYRTTLKKASGLQLKIVTPDGVQRVHARNASANVNPVRQSAVQGGLKAGDGQSLQKGKWGA